MGAWLIVGCVFSYVACGGGNWIDVREERGSKLKDGDALYIGIRWGGRRRTVYKKQR